MPAESCELVESVRSAPWRVISSIKLDNVSDYFGLSKYSTRTGCFHSAERVLFKNKVKPTPTAAHNKVLGESFSRVTYLKC